MNQCGMCLNFVDKYKCKSCVDKNYFESKFKLGDKVRIIGPSLIYSLEDINRNIKKYKIKEVVVTRVDVDNLEVYVRLDYHCSYRIKFWNLEGIL